MGMGQYFQGLDDRIANQAEQRANDARMRAIDGIVADYQNNPNDLGVQQALAANEGDYLAAAIAERNNYGGMRTPIESLNRAMNESDAARYGVVGGAALGGGMAMTAGAQKLMDLMGLFEEADETEVARDQPLTS